MAFTLLDFQQVLTRVYDEANNRLRTDASLSIDSAVISVNISDTTDSIKIGDGSGHYLTINSNGSINVTSSGLSTGLRVQKVTITDVATPIPSSPLSNRNAISVRVIGANPVYFGTSSVTTAQGYPKFYLEEMVIDIKDNTNVNLYGRCLTGQSSEVRIIEVA